MKTFILGIIAMATSSMSSLAQQKAVQKATINTPGVQCEACKTRIENHLVHEYGVS
jgi:hypothetical protein